MSVRRQLTKRERDSLYGLLEMLAAVRAQTLALRALGWTPPTDLATFDDGMEVIRALATDTRSLVRSEP